MIRCCLGSAFLVAALLGVQLAAADPLPLQPCPLDQIPLADLLAQTQTLHATPQHMTLVWWVPDLYWQAVLPAHASVTAEQAKELLSKLERYTVIAVADADLSAMGGLTFTDEESVIARSNILLPASADKPEQAISASSPKQLRDEARANPQQSVLTVLSVIKPILVNALGTMGTGTHFLLFPRQSLDPAAIGALHLRVGAQRFSFATPLPALLLPRVCDQCKHEWAGNYNFCPDDGTALQNQRQQPPVPAGAKP